LAPRARSAGVRAKAVKEDGLLDAFCDALWLEDGLSRNTIAAYRADLEQLGAFLKKDFAKVEEAELFAFLGSRKGRASSAARRVSTLKRFYRRRRSGCATAPCSRRSTPPGCASPSWSR
jgi:site-specific recombinase XerD